MRYKNVLCVYPYKRELLDLGYFPPLGLEYIAAAMEDLVAKITIIDMRFEEDIIDFIDNSTDLVCVSVNWGLEESQVCETINKIPNHIRTIVGGRHATTNVNELFERCPNIDIIVRGDGEEIIRNLILKDSLDDITGISYKKNGKIIHHPNRELPPISNLLYPNRNRRRYKYRFAPKGFDLGIELDTVSSSRGCPFNCKFCTFNINPYGKKREWSARTPQSVIDEIKTIDADLIAFIDDNFTYDMNRVEKICDLIIKEGIKKTFVANARIEVARRPDVLAKMAKAGIKILLIGIESTCDRTLKQLNKGFTIKQVKKAFEVLNKFNNILTHGYFIIGNIGEDEQDMMRIAQFAKELGIDSLSLCKLRYEKYSPLGDLVRDSPGYHIGDGGIIYSEKYPPKELKRISRKVARNFYSPAQIVKIMKKLLVNKLITAKFIYHLLLFFFIKSMVMMKRRVLVRS